ncbi:hypothetical protein ACQKQD_32350 [Methylobacterium sp. NPDC080182]|uniref:hypothetical protein n=1 Tax=Methylobacterium sp. NPDC080182 TaxID=3390590 RepID=UPI003D018FD1
MSVDPNLYARVILVAAIDLAAALKASTDTGAEIEVSGFVHRSAGAHGPVGEAMRQGLGRDDYMAAYALAAGLVPHTGAAAVAHLGRMLR